MVWQTWSGQKQEYSLIFFERSQEKAIASKNGHDIIRNHHLQDQKKSH
jgi:AAA15 family ATPase/GTPase